MNHQYPQLGDQKPIVSSIIQNAAIVFRFKESELATKHCRYVLPTERKLHPTFDDEMKTSFGNGKTANATANSWGMVQRNKQSARDMMSQQTTEDRHGGGNQRYSLCLQKGYLDVRFMLATRSPAASATFNLARSMKEFIIAGRQFEENFFVLPLYGDGNPISRPQDVPNSKDTITVYYRHRLAGNNVSGKKENPVDEHDRADEARDVDVQTLFYKRSGAY
jgi:hypothetical protein